MKQNIYDNSVFFNEYDSMRKNDKGLNANDLIEIPTIRKMLPDLNDKKILELGCGCGENCSYFIENGAKYVLGTDISNNMINIAKENVKDDRVEFIVLPMEYISQINDKFDLVISSLAVHYVEDFEKLLNDVYELLNEDGYFIFSQEHPIKTAKILNDECNGTDKMYIGDKLYYLVSDYNVNGKRIINWNNCDVVMYHRNFSYIINTLLKCNFKIEEIIEPVLDDKTLELKPKYKNQFDRPYFLFVKVTKNN